MIIPVYPTISMTVTTCASHTHRTNEMEVSRGWFEEERYLYRAFYDGKRWGFSVYPKDAWITTLTSACRPWNVLP